MGVFAKDVLCTVVVFIYEHCKLIDISTDASKEGLCKEFLVTLNAALVNYRLTTQSQELVATC